MATYGVTFDSNTTRMARILGAALTAYALTINFNRNMTATDNGWYNLLQTSFNYNIVDIPIVLKATLDAVMSSMGWIPAGLHVFLAATFGYFTFKKGQG